MSYFSKNLKYLREEKRLSQSKLAEKLNVNSLTISRWEKEDMGVTVDNAYDVANYFNVSVADLTGKDLANNDTSFSEIELLFDKAKPHLSKDDGETIKFIMNKTIKNYEENKNKDNNS